MLPETSFDPDAVAQVAATLLEESPQRMPVADVERLLAERFGLGRRQVRKVIRQLVQTGEWNYTYELGISFLEPSYCKPARVGERIVLVPGDQHYRTADGEVAVHIAAGASFGDGRHPSTRLAIRGVEAALNRLPGSHGDKAAVLDIGTGSGVLVITAVKLGIQRGLGIDTDPCARFEARRNIHRNRLSDRIRIPDQTIYEIQPTGRFNLVIANLRPPTLRHLAPRICELTTPTGCIVLSGMRAKEMDGMLHWFGDHRCAPVWMADDKEWGAVVCQRQVL